MASPENLNMLRPWARRRILTAEARVAELEAEIARRDAAVARPSRVYAGWEWDLKKKEMVKGASLSEQEDICFDVMSYADGRPARINVKLSSRHGQLEIRGDESISVLPDSGNLIRVTFADTRFLVCCEDLE